MSALSDLFTNIGNTIHRVTGNNTKLKPSQFAKEISKMAYIDNGKITGKVNRTEVAKPVISINNSTGVITAKVTQDQGIIASGTKSSTLQLPTFQDITVTPSTSDQIAVTGGNFMAGDVKVKGDPNLISKNIASGATIFNVKGTAEALRYLQRATTETFYGTQATEIAKSYHTATRKGLVSFVYSAEHGLCQDGVLTDAKGKCYMNSDTYASLVLRGILYAESPFQSVAGVSNKSFAGNLVNHGDAYLDRQTHAGMKHSFNSGYKSVATVGEIAEYYYQMGRVLHEYDKANPPSSLPSDVKAGDLVFWSNDDTNTNFKSVTDVGIFAHKPNFIHHIVKDDPDGDVLVMNYFADYMDNVVLIIRPDYTPTSVPETPKKINLLPQFSYDSLPVQKSLYINGNVFIPQPTGGLGVQVYDASLHTTNTTFYIYDADHPLTLTPGTYKLSGCPKHKTVSSTGTSLTWGIGIEADGSPLKDINGARVWDRGAGSTFKVTSTQEVNIYFYVSASLKDTSPYLVTPSLIRTE